jgi:hypothetical protein
MATSDAMSQSPLPSPTGRRLKVEIAAYVRLAFNEEVELNGWIGEQTMTGESRKGFRRLTVEAQVEGVACKLTFGLRRLRPMPVSGQVMGQVVTGSATVTGGSVAFEGMAGQEPLRYRIEVGGGCTSFGRDLGVHVVSQAFFSEILGAVDRTPDAVMIGLLIPLALRQRDTKTYV